MGLGILSVLPEIFAKVPSFTETVPLNNSYLFSMTCGFSSNKKAANRRKFQPAAFYYIFFFLFSSK